MSTVAEVLIPREKLRFGNVTIEFEFNAPISCSGGIAETFDYLEKTAYATIGVSDLLGGDTFAHIILGQIFRTFLERAKKQKLDYLQKLSINGVESWCLDNGETIALLLPDEY